MLNGVSFAIFDAAANDLKRQRGMGKETVVTCAVCFLDFRVHKDGTIYRHRPRRNPMPRIISGPLPAAKTRAKAGILLRPRQVVITRETRGLGQPVTLRLRAYGTKAR